MPIATTADGGLHYEAVGPVAPLGRPRAIVFDRRIGATAPVPKPRLPILFHHGIGASAEIWSDWISTLVDAHRLVTFDMRGYGRSHIPGPGFAWSLDRMVEDLFAVADAAGLQRFHLVGESIGGTVALAAALARPGRIATLTVSNGAHLGASIQRVEAWRRQLDEGGVKAWSDAFLRDRFHDGAVSPERLALFADQQENPDRQAFKVLNAGPANKTPYALDSPAVLSNNPRELFDLHIGLQ